MTVRSFAELQQIADRAAPVTMAVAGGDDSHAVEAAADALASGLVARVVMCGDGERIDRLSRQAGLAMDDVVILAAADAASAAALAVQSVRDGTAQALAKGRIDSAVYFRAILNRDTGLRLAPVLSNLTLFEMPSYHKLLAITDNGVIPSPTLDEKRQIIENTRPLFCALGIDPVKVGVVAATEKVTAALPATTDAAALKCMNLEGALTGFVVDGPFGYDACIDHAAAVAKGLGDSKVAGDPDLLLLANLETANALGKALKFHGQARSGGLVMGAACPVMLNSRSDSAERRLNSLLMAIAIIAAATP